MPSQSQVETNRKPRDSEIDIFGVTHAGKVRKVNQDHYLLCSLHREMKVHGTSLPNLDELPLSGERLAFLAMVADGVGGGTKGEEASRIALSQVAQYVASTMRCYYSADASAESFMEALQEAATRCHAEVIKKGERDPDLKGMATTLTMLMGVWPWLYVLQVGDSRHYLLREGELTQITRDQTMAQDLFDQGVFTRTDAMRSRFANVLSSAIGGQTTAPVVTRLKSEWQNVHLLCSDGLTKHVSDDRIRDVLKNMKSARQACDELLQAALDDGGTDNITIVVGRAVPAAE
ncbi:MAG TPA: protein phosphatase 2C domain-containing protein [Gemmatimonadales bacterium]|nr:protein phosphatase 2C domain-containing protein [Gemmatimonadales bacterium]